MKRWALGGAASILISAALVAQAPQTTVPTFRAGVEYVEVEARVVDAQGNAIAGLTKDNFQIFEDRVAQQVATFSAVDLPVDIAAPVPEEQQQAATVHPDVSSNTRVQAAGRLYLIVFDDRYIAPMHTNEVRRTMRDFVSRYLGPDDLAAVLTIGYSHALQTFTSDKPALIAAIDHLIGAKGQSGTVEGLTNIQAKAAMSPLGGPPAPVRPGPDGDASIANRRASSREMLGIVRSMSAIPARSKAIILFAEGVDAPRINDLGSLALTDDLRSGYDLDRLANVPFYPIDPRGLTSLAEESIEIGKVTGDPRAVAADGLKTEIETSQRSLRDLADDTGGLVSITNDFKGAFERIVRRTSAYYVLGYNSTNTRRDGQFRTVQVKVSVAGARVIARRGYTAATSRPPQKAANPGPAGASEAVRQALNSPLPLGGLALSITAAPFRDRGSDDSVAIVLESSGEHLQLTEQNNAFGGALDVAVAALGTRGAIRASDAKQLQFNFTPEVRDRIAANGFRWLSRLPLKPGHYQLRVAAAGGTREPGSVWYDVDVPDFSSGDLAMSGILLASAAAFRTPTVRPDKALEGILPGPPTTARRFPPGDELTAFAEVYANRLADGRDVDVTVSIRNDRGVERFRITETKTSQQLRAAEGVHRSIVKIPLNLIPGVYVLTIDAKRRGGDEQTVSRSVPFRVG